MLCLIFSEWIFFLQVLCAWDIFEHVLIQKITVKFPFSQRLPDHGPSILHVLQPTNSLCVLCNEYIAEFKVGSSSTGSTPSALDGSGSNKLGGSVWSVTSHKHPLCAAVYNPHFRQVSDYNRTMIGHDRDYKVGMKNGEWEWISGGRISNAFCSRGSNYTY